jgi:hypothetical protein
VGFLRQLHEFIPAEHRVWLLDKGPGATEGNGALLDQLMRSSEALDTDSDDFDPELLPVDFDDEAIWEAWQGLRELHADNDDDYC